MNRAEIRLAPKLARFLQRNRKVRKRAQTEDQHMKLGNKKTSGTLAQVTALAASATLLIAICFAPALAQQKDQINHDGPDSRWPIASSYLA
jgi:hypothetical protein